VTVETGAVESEPLSSRFKLSHHQEDHGRLPAFVVSTLRTDATCIGADRRPVHTHGVSEMGWNETRWSYKAERWLHRHHRWVPNFMFGWPTWFGNRKAIGIRGIPGDLAYLRDSVLKRLEKRD
jgi:hypothetical protein